LALVNILYHIMSRRPSCIW